jgi:hypothetical protein
VTRAHPLGPAGRRGAGQRAGPREGAPGQGGDRPAARLNPPGSPAAVPVTPGARSGAWHRDGTGRQGRCVEDGIRARSKRSMIGEQWWSRRLIDVLESFGMSGRLAWAGTTLVPARSSASRSSGYVTAQVQGSAPALPGPNPPQWAQAAADPATGRQHELPTRRSQQDRRTAIIPAWSAIKRTKVACAISDQMILSRSRRTPQP